MQTVWFPIAGYCNAVSVVNFVVWYRAHPHGDQRAAARPRGFQPNLLIGIGNAGAVAHQSACDVLLTLREVQRRGYYDDRPDILSAAPQ
jgi:hypothetical protein